MACTRDGNKRPVTLGLYKADIKLDRAEQARARESIKALEARVAAQQKKLDEYEDKLDALAKVTLLLQADRDAERMKDISVKHMTEKQLIMLLKTDRYKEAAEEIRRRQKK
jgi:hypothetical protein